MIGAYAGLRPLLDSGEGSTADLSRKHAVLTSRTGVVTVVGGKLTTYRRMAQDALDVVHDQTGRGGPASPPPCRSSGLRLGPNSPPSSNPLVSYAASAPTPRWC